MIRKALEKDIPEILNLLKQVNLVHHKGRPDLFKIGTKYSETDLKHLMHNPNNPILVYTDQNDEVLGYCFCVIVRRDSDPILTDVKTLYIDDLCVDERCRRKGIGKALYGSAVELAKKIGCHNLTLNAWACNPSALGFYKSLGLVPQKVCLEKIIK